MTLYKLRTSVEFDAAHFLPSYEGKCKNLHGHRWIVNIEIDIEGDCTSMIIDFTIIKHYIDDNYDHRILNECPFSDDAVANIENVGGIDLTETPFKWGSFENPTAENIAKKIAKDITELLPSEVKECTEFVSVELYESPKNAVTFINPVKQQRV